MMLRQGRPVRRARVLLLGGALALVGCWDHPTAPDPAAPVRPMPPAPVPVRGPMQITISGIGAVSSSLQASAGLWGGPSPGAASGATRSLTPVSEGTEAGIQLEPLSTGSFTTGVRGAGGQRYLYATFRVRNASVDGVAYATPRTNLTFFAVGTGTTLGGTSLWQLRRFDGSPAAAAIAPAVIPTGAVAVNSATGHMTSVSPDVIQVLSEEEAATVPRLGEVTAVFPYGFVVRNATSTTTRTLPANPAVGQFDGIVTFAFRLPLQATPAEDPFTLGIIVQAVDDSETRITQSVEEQTDGVAAFEARALSLGATSRRLLAGGTSALATDPPYCGRTAGTPALPTAFMAPPPRTVVSFSPDPFGTGPHFLAPTEPIAATLANVSPTPTASTFAVHGSQSGRAFLGGGYTGAGTPTIGTPPGHWFPGEEIEVTLTSALTCMPRVAKFRAAAAAGSGTFGPELGAYDAPNVQSLALGDLDGDGKPDLVFGRYADRIVVVRLGFGDGTFGPEVQYPTGAAGDGRIRTVALGDVNGDGRLDLLVATFQGGNVDVRLNNGDGSFGPATLVPVTVFTLGVTTGDLNGDGRLDLVTYAGATAIQIRLGDGDGTFGSRHEYAISGLGALTLGDLNGDGRLDVVASSIDGHDLQVLLGNGDGTLATRSIVATGLTSAGSTAIGDLNEDGKLDLATRGKVGGVSVILGRGDGTFGPPTVYATTAPGTTFLLSAAMVLGDVNGDGHLDMVSADGGGVTVMLGRGDGTFAPAVVHPGQSVALDLADLNGDGRLDLVFVDNANNLIHARLGQP